MTCAPAPSQDDQTVTQPFRAQVVAACALALGGLPAVPAAAQQGSSINPSDTFRVVGFVVSVTGRGAPRGATALDTLLIVKRVPAGQSPLRTIERLPGVNVNSSDAFGAYEWSTRVTIRGFQTQQIGQTFDGVPLGDMS